MRTDARAGRLNAAYEAGYGDAFNVEGFHPSRVLGTLGDEELREAYASGYDSGVEARGEYLEHLEREARA